MTAWTDEQIRQCWLDEVTARFVAENVSYRAMDARDLELVKAEGDAHLLPPNILEPRDSLLFELWTASTVTLHSNVAEVLLPRGFAICRDVLAMLEGTEAAWGYASLHAGLLDGEPRISVQVILVDSWDDERSARWKAEHPTWPEDVLDIVEWERCMPDDDDGTATVDELVLAAASAATNSGNAPMDSEHW